MSMWYTWHFLYSFLSIFCSKKGCSSLLVLQGTGLEARVCRARVKRVQWWNQALSTGITQMGWVCIKKFCIILTSVVSVLCLLLSISSAMGMPDMFSAWFRSFLAMITLWQIQNKTIGDFFWSRALYCVVKSFVLTSFSQSVSLYDNPFLKMEELTCGTSLCFHTFHTVHNP